MIPNKCPKCGAGATFDGCGITMRCGTWISPDGWTVEESRGCLINQRDQLAERVKRLEAAGDYWIPRDSDAQEAWLKAKEAQP